MAAKKHISKRSYTLDVQSYEIRRNWFVGNKCLIHSKSRNEWIEGKIVKIYNDNNGEWLSIAYKNRIKDVPRFDTEVIAPVINNDSIENKKQQNSNSYCNEITKIEHCNCKQILYILTNFIFDDMKNIKLNKYKDSILEYIKINDITGQNITSMNRKQFASKIAKYVKDTKANGPCLKLYKNIIDFDTNRIHLTNTAQTLISQCNTQQILHILSNHILPQTPKLLEHQNKIEQYFIKNDINGIKLLSLNRKQFRQDLKTELNDNSLKSVLNQLHINFMVYDFESTKSNEMPPEITNKITLIAKQKASIALSTTHKKIKTNIHKNDINGKLFIDTFDINDGNEFKTFFNQKICGAKSTKISAKKCEKFRHYLINKIRIKNYNKILIAYNVSQLIKFILNEYNEFIAHLFVIENITEEILMSKGYRLIGIQLCNKYNLPKGSVMNLCHSIEDELITQSVTNDSKTVPTKPIIISIETCENNIVMNKCPQHQPPYIDSDDEELEMMNTQIYQKQIDMASESTTLYGTQYLINDSLRSQSKYKHVNVTAANKMKTVANASKQQLTILQDNDVSKLSYSSMNGDITPFETEFEISDVNVNNDDDLDTDYDDTLDDVLTNKNKSKNVKISKGTALLLAPQNADEIDKKVVESGNESYSDASTTHLDDSDSTSFDSEMERNNWNKYSQYLTTLFYYFAGYHPLTKQEGIYMSKNQVIHFLGIIEITKYWNGNEIFTKMSNNLSENKVTLNEFMTYFCNTEINSKANDIKKYITKQASWQLLLKAANIFDKVDTDHSGYLDYNEFQIFGQMITLNDKETEVLWKTIVSNDSKQISIIQLFQWFKKRLEDAKQCKKQKREANMEWSKSHSSFKSDSSVSDNISSVKIVQNPNENTTIVHRTK